MLGLADFLAGWVGGIAGLIIGHPTDTIKVRQQALGHNFKTTVLRTYRYEGFLGFYNGFLAPFLTIGPTNAIFFSTYGTCLRYLQDNPSNGRVDLHDPNWKRKVAFAGLIGGTAQTIATCPVELVKIKLQMKTAGKGHWKPHFEEPYNNTFETMKGVFKKKGVMGFYRGFTPMFIRDGPTSGIYTLVYELLLPRGEVKPLWQQIMAGGIAGVASWSIIVPFDVVKSKMQSDCLTNPQYKGMVDCFIKSYKADGYKIFLRGFWLTMIRAFPVNAAISVGYESCLILLEKFMNEPKNTS